MTIDSVTSLHTMYTRLAQRTHRDQRHRQKNNEKRLCILYYTIRYIYVHSNADSQLSRNQRKCVESVLRAKQSLWWEGSREMFHLQRRCQSSLQTGLIKMSTRSTWERQRIILFCLWVDQYYIGLQCINQSFPGCLLTVRNYTKKWSKQFEIWQHCDDDVSLCKWVWSLAIFPAQRAAISNMLRSVRPSVRPLFVPCH